MSRYFEPGHPKLIEHSFSNDSVGRLAYAAFGIILGYHTKARATKKGLALAEIGISTVISSKWPYILLKPGEETKEC